MPTSAESLKKRLPENTYFCFIDYTKAFDSVDHNKLWKTLNEMGKPDHLTCLLRNLYAGQEVTELDMDNRLVPNRERLYIVTCLFTLYIEYIMQNARLGETQAGIKIAGRNISNLRYADDTTLMAESKEKAS